MSRQPKPCRRRSTTRPWLSATGLLLGLPPMAGLTPALADSPAWQPVYSQQGISVKTRPVEGSSIDAFRAEIEVPAPVDAVLAVLADPAACPHWIHGCTRAQILSSGGFYQRDTYQINDMPWPVQDRDLVLRIQIDELSDGRFRLAMTSLPELLPPSDYVRIRDASGFYLLTPQADGHTRIEWEQHTDPGGSLPSWLINQLLVDVPVQSLSHLRELVSSPAYADQRLLRDSQGRILGWAASSALAQMNPN